MIILGGVVSKALVFLKLNFFCVVIVSNYNENPSNNWKLGNISNKIFIAILGENSLQNVWVLGPKVLSLEKMFLVRLVTPKVGIKNVDGN